MKQRQLEPDELTDQAIAQGDFFGVTGGKLSCIWRFDGTTGVRVGIPNPDHRSMVTLGQGQTLRAALSGLPLFNGATFVIHRMTLPPGGYYPHIARPSDQHPNEAAGFAIGYSQELAIESLSQVRSLVEMLDAIFGMVHPSNKNLDCYGTAIRNLLILACTECEAQWRGILTANGYSTLRYTTADYVKLLPALRLAEYQVALRHYPSLPAVAPFCGWDASQPTKSVAWYDDYNAAKHDRVSNFDRATLRAAYEAVCAVWIVVIAQYGIVAKKWFDDLDNYFKLESGPLWRYSDVYTIPYDGSKAQAGPVNYPF